MFQNLFKSISVISKNKSYLTTFLIFLFYMQFVLIPFAHGHEEKKLECDHQEQNCQVCEFIEGQNLSNTTPSPCIIEVVRNFESTTFTKPGDELYNSPFSNQQSARAPPPTSNSNI